MALDTRPDSAILTYLASSPDLKLKEEDIAAAEELHGDHNALWRIRSDTRDIVLKMFLDAGQARGRRQFSNQESASRLGLAPAPIAFDRYPEGLSRQVLLYEWFPGSPMRPCADSHVEELAAGVAAAHARPPGEHTRLSPHPVNPHYQWSLIQGSRRLLEDGPDRGRFRPLYAMVTEALEKAETLAMPELECNTLHAPAMIHGDLQAEHCLFWDDELRIVDWEMGGLGDPAREICHVFLHVLPHLEEESRVAWLRIYQERHAVPGLKQRVRCYEVMLPVASMLELLLLPAAATEDAAAEDECRLLQLAFELCLKHVDSIMNLQLTESDRDEASAFFLSLRRDLYERQKSKETAT